MFLEKIDGDMVAFYCPGCECSHMVDPKRWAVDLVHDTIHPSVLVHENWKMPNDWDPDTAPRDESGKFVTQENGKILGAVKTPRCHSFVRNGKIQYLNDCTHALAGKIVDMEEM